HSAPYGLRAPGLQQVRPARPLLGEVHAGREVEGGAVAEEALRLVDADAGARFEEADHLGGQRMDRQIGAFGSGDDARRGPAAEARLDLLLHALGEDVARQLAEPDPFAGAL